MHPTCPPYTYRNNPLDTDLAVELAVSSGGMTKEREKTLFLQAAPVIPKQSAPAADAVLLSIYPAGPLMGRRFTLNGTEHFVGRLAELDIALEGEGLSRKHARIYRTEQGWFVEDLGSTNGTMINDVKTERGQLRDGDLVRFGVATCKFLAGDNIEAQYHEEIYRMSIQDGLTGVHNKRYFLETFEREIASAARRSSPLSLVMLDIDHFKKINDTHGHLAGDAALKELCRRLKPRIRTSDIFARYGGEEFSVLLPDTSLAGALELAEDLRLLVNDTPFTHDDLRIPCTISLGVAQLDLANPGRPDDLIKRADDNLYSAKRGGRNQVVG
jgi:two-component system cell cycle response regulator